jgi:hypothetical protein
MMILAEKRMKDLMNVEEARILINNMKGSLIFYKETGELK